MAAKQLAAAGIKLHPGETVRYVIVAAKDKVKEWRTMPLALMDGLEYDVAKYLELLERASTEILDGIVSPSNSVKKIKRLTTDLSLELPLDWGLPVKPLSRTGPKVYNE